MPLRRPSRSSTRPLKQRRRHLASTKIKERLPRRVYVDMTSKGKLLRKSGMSKLTSSGLRATRERCRRL